MAITLQSVQRGIALKPPKICIYGVGGVGKTTFAAAAPSPIFLCTEEGLGSLGVARFELRDGDPVIRSWGELLECVSALYAEPHDFQTIVLDSIDFAEPLLWAHVCATVPNDRGQMVKRIEDYGYGKGYMHATLEARELLAGLDALRNDRGMAVILVGHNEVKRHEPPDSDAFDRYQLRLHKGFAALVHDWSDALLFAQWKTHLIKEDAGFNKQRSRGVGRGDRVLYTEERPAFWAKNRYGLPYELPLSWQAFTDRMTATINTEPPTKEEN